MVMVPMVIQPYNFAEPSSLLACVLRATTTRMLFLGGGFRNGN